MSMHHSAVVNTTHTRMIRFGSALITASGCHTASGSRLRERARTRRSRRSRRTLGALVGRRLGANGFTTRAGQSARMPAPQPLVQRSSPPNLTASAVNAGTLCLAWSQTARIFWRRLQAAAREPLCRRFRALLVRFATRTKHGICMTTCSVQRSGDADRLTTAG
jgi:hypothetical protein